MLAGAARPAGRRGRCVDLRVMPGRPARARGLRRHLGPGHVAELWRRAAIVAVPGARPCSGCGGPLRVWREPLDAGEIELDACAACGLLRCDAGEDERLHARTARPARASRTGGEEPWGSLLLGELLVGVLEGLFDGLFDGL